MENMKINEIAKKAHEHAKSRGYYKKCPGLAIGEKLREEVDEYDGAFGEGRDCGEAANLVLGSLFDCECLIVADTEFFEAAIKNTIPDELTDIIITAMAGMVELGYDPEKHIAAKMTYNAVRADHGEAD